MMEEDEARCVRGMEHRSQARRGPSAWRKVGPYHLFINISFGMCSSP